MGVEAALRKAALGAGFTILLIGLALAQTTPPASDPPAATPSPQAPQTPQSQQAPANPPATTQSAPNQGTPPAATQGNPQSANPAPNPPAASQANPPPTGNNRAGRNDRSDTGSRNDDGIDYPIAPDVTVREMREICATEVGNSYEGWRKRMALRECLEDKRVARSEARQQLRIVRRTGWVDCRREFAEQRMTERERLTAIETCYAKKDPEFAQMLECRKPLETREPRLSDSAFRREMRECLNDRRRG